MVTDTLVSAWRPFFEAVRDVARVLNREHGPLYFAGALQLEGRPSDEWVFLVGSQELMRDRGKAIDAVVHTLATSAPREHADRIRRVDILDALDPFYLGVSKSIRQPLGGITEIQNCRFGDVDVGHMALFVSQPIGNGGMRSKTTRRGQAGSPRKKASGHKKGRRSE